MAVYALHCSQCNCAMGIASVPMAVCKSCALKAREAYLVQRGDWGPRNDFIRLIDSLQMPKSISDSLRKK